MEQIEQEQKKQEQQQDTVIADPKYGQLGKDLTELLTRLEYSNFRENKPVPFCGLMIYPVQVRDFEDFSNCTTCLTLNKNEDPKGVMSSHLNYLISKTQIAENDEGKLWSYKLQRLCEIVFHLQNGTKCQKCGHIITYDSEEFTSFLVQVQEYLSAEERGEKIEAPSLVCPECGGTEFIEMMKIIKDQGGKKNSYSLLIDGHKINSQDFTKLRQIILYQNFYDYVDDSWVDPEVKKDHDEKMKIEQRKNDLHASIEKKVVCLSIATNYKIDEIYDMPIRTFTLALATVDDLINYKIMKQSVMSGFVSLPKGQTIEHWIYKPNKDMYGDSYKTTDDFNNL